MGIVQAFPKPDSYCTEWIALKFNAAEGVFPVKKMMKGSPWSIHIVLGDTADPYIVATSTYETVVVHHGEWLVRSPHGKFWFLSDDEFQRQFTYEPES